MNEPLRNRSSETQLTSARKRLLELAVSGPSHEDVLARALAILSEVFFVPWEFREESGEPRSEDGVPVMALGKTLGYLTPVDPTSLCHLDGQRRELGLAFGLCLLVADQGRAIAEMESASADFLRFAPDALFVLDGKGLVTMTNRRALELVDLGEHDVVGRPLRSVLGYSAGSGQTDFPSIVEDSGRLEVEVCTGGGTRLVSLGFSIVAEGQVLCLARDITKERLAHLAVRRAERGVMLGQAVEYLVHEVNNPLAALLSSTATERRRMRELVEKLEATVESGAGARDDRMDLLETASRLRSAAETAHANAERIRATMTTLRHAHRRLGEIAPSWVDLGYEVSLAIGIVEQEMSTGELPRVEVARELGPIPQVLAPPLVMAETVASILRNAVHYAGSSSGQAGRAWVRANLQDEEVRIEIEDNGPGIPGALVDRVFMPFFTTRADEGALGLGLAQARDATGRLGGELSVVMPREGSGACLRLSLPLKGASFKEREGFRAPTDWVSC
ncbi:MAG: ATP-binding protein [Myxococcota bacterium]|jgi:signal transduction histidine kinase|nr:ATP-binding protein [Myxococcota bacterium]